MTSFYACQAKIPEVGLAIARSKLAIVSMGSKDRFDPDSVAEFEMN